MRATGGVAVRAITVAGAIGLGLVQGACAPGADEVLLEREGSIARAVAVLRPTAGYEASGRVSFSPVGGAVRIDADLDGLSPGEHGIHVHEFGDCSAPDAASAGGHFDPEGIPHAGPDSVERHVGDLGNLTADSTGAAHFERVDALVALDGPRSILGRAIVVHAAADDLTSQPSGAAGDRVACGVIGIAGP